MPPISSSSFLVLRFGFTKVLRFLRSRQITHRIISCCYERCIDTWRRRVITLRDRTLPIILLNSRLAESRMVLFYQGSAMQLGAEGFTVGFLYGRTRLSFVTHLLVRVKNTTVQRVFMIFAMFVSFLAVRKVIFLDNWKTEYNIHGYWPYSWK